MNGTTLSDPRRGIRAVFARRTVQAGRTPVLGRKQPVVSDRVRPAAVLRFCMKPTSAGGKADVQFCNSLARDFSRATDPRSWPLRPGRDASWPSSPTFPPYASSAPASACQCPDRGSNVPALPVEFDQRFTWNPRRSTLGLPGPRGSGVSQRPPGVRRGCASAREITPKATQPLDRVRRGRVNPS